MITKPVAPFPVLISTDKTYRYLGQCHCGNVKIELLLTNILSKYEPRACDCDFCTTRKLTYLSDPQGQLNIISSTLLKTRKQGSNQASFKLCSMCDEVICVNYRFGDSLKGALNIRLLDEQFLLSQAQTVSPKDLSPQQKIARWQNFWMPVMTLDNRQL